MRPLACLALLSMTTSCIVGADERARAEVPPPPLPEFRYAAPAPHMTWVKGAWHFDATDYVWIPGHWESPPPSPDTREEDSD